MMSGLLCHSVPVLVLFILSSSACAAQPLYMNDFESGTTESVVAEWHMVAVSEGNQQADAHLLVVPGGLTVLIDTGEENTATTALVPYLLGLGIDHVDVVYITHAHRDHYGGLRSLMDAGIGLETVWMHLPDKGRCDVEIPWGCKYTDVVTLFDELEAYGVRRREPQAGDHLDLAAGVSSDVLYAFDGVNTPVGVTDVNDMSLVMMLEAGMVRTLFTGDLNVRIGGYLADFGEGLEAELLKVPHHGVASLAPVEFFEAVDPLYAFVPTTKALWCAPSAQQVHDWSATEHVPTFATGEHGNVVTRFWSTAFQITTDKTATGCQ